MLLWEEYRQREPDGYRYSRWCELYRAWEGRLSPTMRQAHPAGERLFVDYAGQTVDLIDGSTGEVRPAQIFVAVMGASNYTYAEATLTQTPAGLDRRACPGARLHGRRTGAAGARQPEGRGRSRQLVRARPQPHLSRPGDALRHRDPADAQPESRATRPRSRSPCWWSSAGSWRGCRNRRFFSLAELNRAIAELVADLNARPMRRLGVSRRDLFLELDRPALKELPAEPYEYAEWRPRRVGLDYHVDIDGALLLGAAPADPRAARRAASPSTRSSCSARASASRCTCAAAAAAATRRSPNTCRARTGAMPSGRSSASAPTRRRSVRAPPSLTALILESRPHPEQGYRACIGILRLARHYGAERLEAACDRGLDIGARSYGSIQSILKHGLDRRPPPRPASRASCCPITPTSAAPATTINRLGD